MPRKHRPKKMCCKCGSVGHYKCAGCPYGKRVRYCGRVCQKADWGRHQVKCPRDDTTVAGKIVGEDVTVADLETMRRWLSSTASVSQLAGYFSSKTKRASSSSCSSSSSSSSSSTRPTGNALSPSAKVDSRQTAKQTTSSPSTVPVSAAAVPSYVRSLPTCTEKVIYWQEPITGEVSNGYRVLVPGGRTVVTTAEMRTVDGAITLCGILGIVADEFALGAWAVSDILAEQVTLFRSKTSFLRAVRPCVLVVLCTDDTFADSAPDSFNSRRFQAGEGRVWSDV
jgi:hypothetical protein